MQEAGRSCCPPRPRRRLCLLKGCEQPFDPSHPQARYCSAACRTEARRWRCWRAGRTYRASAAGQTRRREQSQRYRERLQERRTEPPGEPQKPREGQRPGPEYEDFCCARPGCYELLALEKIQPLIATTREVGKQGNARLYKLKRSAKAA